MTVQGRHKENKIHKDKKGKKSTAEVKKPSELSKAMKHKPIDSDEDDEVPQNEPGTYSNTQPPRPILYKLYQVKWKLHLKKTLAPKAGKPATRKSVVRIIYLFVDDRFGTNGDEMEQRVLTRLRQDFLVGSEDWNDVSFTRQRTRWTQDSQNGPYIEISQNKAIDELEEILVERNTKEDLHCTPSMHTMHRSPLRQRNWLQSKT